ncbi:protein-L-isoaspartate O-methyltransferase [Brevundimonas sp.]|jgi:protein-L-isoaspartate(D-aspartate) O-methyltransferase|uniref:protein-L-isoaspartate O-methyltransferase family protein n=1 Tax=Brevundimonas sp. TaxID=1871086 RepID=UPI0037836D38
MDNAPVDTAAARKVMVDSQVRVNDVTDRGIQAALLSVAREKFCAPDRAWAAYAEVEVDITGDRKLMMARDVAKLLQALQPRSGETALAIAAPYAAAVLAAMGLSVTAQDSDQAVLDVVSEGLAEAGVATVMQSLAQPSGDNYDLIVSEVGVAQRPEAWIAALKVGGRLAVVERSGPAGKAVLYVKGREGVSRRELFDSNPGVVAEMTPAPAFAL